MNDGGFLDLCLQRLWYHSALCGVISLFLKIARNSVNGRLLLLAGFLVLLLEGLWLLSDFVDLHCSFVHGVGCLSWSFLLHTKPLSGDGLPMVMVVIA